MPSILFAVHPVDILLTIFFAAIIEAQLQCYELEKKMEFKPFFVF